MQHTLISTIFSIIQVHVPCKDKSSACSIWSKLGYCDNGYRLFMMGNCEKSCGFCSDSVPDPYIVDVDGKFDNNDEIIHY